MATAIKTDTAKAAIPPKESGTVAEARAKVEELALQEVERYRRLPPKKAELFAAQQAQDFQKAAPLREEVEYLEDVETRPKSQQMSDDARDMRLKARLLRMDLKSNSVPEHGTAYGVTAEELIDGLMQLPEIMGPTVASVYEWVVKRRGQGKYGQRMVMVWYGGRITELEWHCIIREAPREIARK